MLMSLALKQACKLLLFSEVFEYNFSFLLDILISSIIPNNRNFTVVTHILPGSDEARFSVACIQTCSMCHLDISYKYLVDGDANTNPSPQIATLD